MQIECSEGEVLKLAGVDREAEGEVRERVSGNGWWKTELDLSGGGWPESRSGGYKRSHQCS